MFNEKKFVKEEDLFNLLTERDDMIKNRIANNFKCFCNERDLFNREIQKLKEQIKNLKEEISKYKDENFYHETIKDKYLYLIYSIEQDIVYSFETEEVAINFFKNEIWQKKPFKANKMMWDAIYEAIRNGDIQLAEDEINDE